MTPYCNCGVVATPVTRWRSEMMPTSAYWYDCERCIIKTEKVLGDRFGVEWTTERIGRLIP